MAKYTVELSDMLTAYVNNIKIIDQEQDVIIHGIDWNGHSVPDFDYKSWHYEYPFVNNPVRLVHDYADLFMRSHLGAIPENYTTDDTMNKAITGKLFETIVRHFYGYEIGQENPLYWWNLMQGFLDEYLPIFILDYQQLMIDKQAFITGLSNSTSTNTASGNVDTTSSGNNIDAQAQTPQNELKFALDSADPAKSYNFKYSDAVHGAKQDGTSNTTQKNDSNGTMHTDSRAATIMSLINEMESFNNGVYINLFTHMKNYGLFMLVN